MPELLRFAAFAMAAAGLVLYALAVKQRIDAARFDQPAGLTQAPILDTRRKIALGLTLGAIALHWASAQI